jgi:hypothetical protein
MNILFFASFFFCLVFASNTPTTFPTFGVPSIAPSSAPVVNPTGSPTTNPTGSSYIVPTLNPTGSPYIAPTLNPVTTRPTVKSGAYINTPWYISIFIFIILI